MLSRPDFLLAPIRRTFLRNLNGNLHINHRTSNFCRPYCYQQPRLLQAATPFRIATLRSYSSGPSSSNNQQDVTANEVKSQSSPIPVPNGTPAPDAIATAPAPATPLPLWERLGPLTTAAKAYSRTQQRRPWLTQIVSVLIIYLASDMVAQSICGEEYDPKRTARHLLVGVGSAIPTYCWFMFLARNFNYSSFLLSLAVKIVVNQIVLAPLFNIYFFGSNALLAGCTLSETYDRLVYALPTSVANSAKFWPFVTAFSITFIQPQFRSIFSGVIAVGWQSYLAWLNRQAELKLETEHPEKHHDVLQAGPAVALDAE